MQERHTLGRREFLAAAAASGAVAVAGCVGGSGPSNPTDTDQQDQDWSGGGSDGSEAGSCTDLTSGYVGFDGGARPLLFDMEVPAMVAEAVKYEDFGSFVMVTGAVWIDYSESTQVQFRVSQIVEASDPYLEEMGNEVLTEIEFGGETVKVYRVFGNREDSVFLEVELPHEVDGETKYYVTKVSTAFVGDDPTKECTAALEAAAQHVVESFQPNPDTTVGA